MSKVVYIDFTYMKYRKMWKEDRWKFSGEYVKFHIKDSKVGLSEEEKSVLSIMDRIIEEHDGMWTEGYSFEAESIKAKIKYNKDKEN